MSLYSSDDLFDPSDPGGARRQDCLTRTLAVAAPLLVGGALMVVAMAGRSRVGAWLRGFFTAGGGDTRRHLRGRMEQEPQSLPRLRRELLGRTKAQVAARFGPPRTAVMTRPQPGAIGQTAFWSADTWYYAVDPASQTAMAVTFDDDVARSVEFLDTPAAEE